MTMYAVMCKTCSDGDSIHWFDIGSMLPDNEASLAIPYELRQAIPIFTNKKELLQAMRVANKAGVPHSKYMKIIKFGTDTKRREEGESSNLMTARLLTRQTNATNGSFWRATNGSFWR